MEAQLEQGERIYYIKDGKKISPGIKKRDEEGLYYKIKKDIGEHFFFKYNGYAISKPILLKLYSEGYYRIKIEVYKNLKDSKNRTLIEIINSRTFVWLKEGVEYNYESNDLQLVLDLKHCRRIK